MNTNTNDTATVGDNSAAVTLTDAAHEAIIANRKGEKICGAAYNRALHAVAHLMQPADGRRPWEAMLVAKDKSGDIVYGPMFIGLDHAFNPNLEPRDSAGKEIRAAKTEIIRLVASLVFGIDDATKADDQFIRRVVQGARVLVANLDTADIELSPKGYLRAPLGVMKDAPDADKAKESEIEAYEASKDKLITLDGGANTTARLLQRLAPKPEPRTPQPAHDDDGASFVASLKLVLACVQSFTGAEGECDIAPTKAIESLMHDIMLASQVYFAVYGAHAEETKAA